MRVKDVLTGPAAGMRVNEVRSEITTPVQTDVDDTDDLAAALPRTTVTTATTTSAARHRANVTRETPVRPRDIATLGSRNHFPGKGGCRS